MNAGIYIEMDILSSMFCLLLFYQQKRHKIFDFLGSTTFNSLLWSSVGIMWVDIVSWLFMADIIPHTDAMLMLAQTVYYLIQTILPLFFLLYCASTTGKKLSKKAQGILCIPILCTLIILILNVKSGFAFYVENNIVERGAGFPLAIAAAMLYVTASLHLCGSFYVKSKNDSPERRKIAFHMFICVLISFIGAVACAFVNYISPWHVFVGALIYLYIQLHSYREQSLDILAYTDSLTGLKNYAMYAHIKEKMAAKIANDPKTRFAVAVMDVNNLKKVNDEHGHEAGNALILCASKLMCDVFGHSPVCRIGGDEFVAILENSDYENRDALFQSFMERMKHTSFYADYTMLPLTAALGMCEYSPSKHRSFDDVFQAADSAMYENKAQAKKNKV
ncbi:MAG: GGDEF domain-containing protein [Oscillospiraceae bacterium]|nr:GGDEF domain-containing protein [Oscillospiraceae bacterium]